MFQKALFIFAHQLAEPKFYPTYKKLVDSQWKTYSEQTKNQEKQLQRMINFAYKNVPYYHKLFNKLKLEPSDIRTIHDLKKLPILTKNIIKQNLDDFKPVNLDSMNYYKNATSGSTGSYLQFRMLKYDRFLHGALLYRGWGYAGYELGDKMVFLAGSSLDIGYKPFVVRKTHEIARNIRKLSSFDMTNISCIIPNKRHRIIMKACCQYSSNPFFQLLMVIIYNFHNTSFCVYVETTVLRTLIGT